MIYFTSDLHFNHARIIDFQKRPFTDVDHMHDSLIKNWNKVVSASDTVFVLGDFAFNRSGFPDPNYYLNQLNGRKILFKGNHDEYPEKYAWDQIFSKGIITINNKPVLISHYPYLEIDKETDKFFKTKWYDQHRLPTSDMPLIHGHVHGRFTLHKNCLNVSTERWKYTPVSLDQLTQELVTAGLI